ncbi:MAG: endonuclease/exonuclease/phosphatase family protein [Planctomycetota bacterium]
MDTSESSSADTNVESDPQKSSNQSFRSRLSHLLIQVLILLISAHLFSSLARFHWVADLVAQLRVQLCIGSLIAVAMSVGLYRWKLSMLSLAVLIYSVLPIVPYFINDSNRSDRSDFKLVTANVLTSNQQTGRFMDWVNSENPDLLLVMEIDSNWEKALEQIHANYPYRLVQSRADNFGIGVYSKIRWDRAEIFYADSMNLESIDIRFENFETGSYQGPLQIIGTHPIPPLGRIKWRSRNQQLLKLADYRQFDSECIITGDFNLTPWSPFFEELTDKTDTRDGALGFGIEPSWNLLPTLIGALKLDHVIVSEELGVFRYRVGPSLGSDHRPIICEF